MTDPNTIGVFGISISVYLCASSALSFLQERPRYFTVLALLALSWAILINYYTDYQAKNDLNLSLSRYLLVYIGGILSLEAKTAHQQDPDNGQVQNIGHISYSQRLSFWLFLIMILVIRIPSDDIRDHIQVVAVSTSLTIVGCFVLWRGFVDLFERGYYSAIVALVLAVYGCCSIYYQLIKHFNGQIMIWEWALTFAALKILVTVLLAYRLSIETMTAEERLRPVRTFVFKQLPAAIRPHGY